MKLLITVLLTLVYLNPSIAQEVFPPAQAAEGPGGANYPHNSVLKYDFAGEAEGYWLYEPADPKPQKAQVIVFIHGYGALNPMIYGAWIKHLVRKGNIVIFPRYQKSLFCPSPHKFVENTALAIKNALIELDTGDHVQPEREHLSLVGHSYGGVISANLGVNFTYYGIPQPKALMLCSPGTGPFKGGLLKSYKEMPSDTRLLVLVSDNDRTVGDKIGNLVFETAEDVEYRNLLRQYNDKHGTPNMTAGHNESYAVDEELDNGIRNYSAKRALRKAKTDAMDYYGYWKLFDALMACVREGNHCHVAFGDTEAQRSLGLWSDGTQIKALVVDIPEEPTKLISEKADSSQ